MSGDPRPGSGYVRELRVFLKQFDVVRLGYGDIRLKTIMDWYEATEPPFGIGKKRKEFPDAFAIAILAAYAQNNESFIAVVSEDNDLKASCDRYPSLMHFRSLPVLTELLLSEDDGRVTTVRAALDAAMDDLTTAAYETAATAVSFYQTNDYLNIEQSEVSELEITDLRIVGLGEHECTITFDAVLQARHYFEWDEPDSDGDTHTVRETVTDHYDTSGTVKLTLDDKTGAVAAIPYLSLDDEIEVEKTPEMWWGHGPWR